MEKLKTAFSGLKPKKWAIGLAIGGLVGAGSSAHYLMEEVEEVQPATIVGRAGAVPVAIQGLKGIRSYLGLTCTHALGTQKRGGAGVLKQNCL